MSARREVAFTLHSKPVVEKSRLLTLTDAKRTGAQLSLHHLMYLGYHVYAVFSIVTNFTGKMPGFYIIAPTQTTLPKHSCV